ncbi:MAG: hypothetical protein AAF517_28230 [Planctomycetota bacterium]
MNARHLSLGILIALSFTFSGCSDDDDGTPAPTTSEGFEDDFQGTFRGEIRISREDENDADILRLDLSASGSLLSGTFSTEGTVGSIEGTIDGSIADIAATIVESDDECFGRFEGTLETNGNALELSIEGDDCEGRLIAVGTLRRQ